MAPQPLANRPKTSGANPGRRLNSARRAPVRSRDDVAAPRGPRPGSRAQGPGIKADDDGRMVARSHLAKEGIPEIPPTVRSSDLDRATLAGLRGLGPDYAERVALHLAAAAQLMQSDPQQAYRHARTAADRAGRIAVVRETAGIAAYLTGRYAEASRELKAYHRLAGSHEHLPILADCERGLGRPEKAIDLANSAEGEALRGVSAVELAIVVAGARGDLGDYKAGIALLNRTARGLREPDVKARVNEAKRRLAELASGGDPVVVNAPVELPPSDDEDDDIALFDAEEGAW